MGSSPLVSTCDIHTPMSVVNRNKDALGWSWTQGCHVNTHKFWLFSFCS